MDHLGKKITLCTAAMLSLHCGGCAMLWRDAPTESASRPKVVLDAAWYSEAPSKDVIDRLKSERREHIDNTVSQRKQGNVGVSLDQILTAPAKSDSVPQQARAQSQPNNQPSGAASKQVVLGALGKPPAISPGESPGDAGTRGLTDQTSEPGSGTLLIKVAAKN